MITPQTRNSDRNYWSYNYLLVSKRWFGTGGWVSAGSTNCSESRRMLFFKGEARATSVGIVTLNLSISKWVTH